MDLPIGGNLRCLAKIPVRFEEQTDDTSAMTSHLLCRFLVSGALAISLTLVVPVALQAQSSAQQPTQRSEKTVRVDPAVERISGAKSPAAKRQRLRDCGAKWQDEKKAKGLTGKTAYLKFLTACLKG